MKYHRKDSEPKRGDHLSNKAVGLKAINSETKTKQQPLKRVRPSAKLATAQTTAQGKRMGSGRQGRTKRLTYPLRGKFDEREKFLVEREREGLQALGPGGTSGWVLLKNRGRENRLLRSWEGGPGGRQYG